MEIDYTWQEAVNNILSLTLYITGIEQYPTL